MIDCKSVSFQYDEAGKEQLKDCSFHVEQGECVVLCGRSGCGKTTITRIINGLIPKYFDGNLSGEICVNGEVIEDKELYELADQIGSVFQNPRTQFFNVDTDSEIMFACENKGLSEDKLQNIYESVVSELNLKKLQKRNIFELSGGEKQKIAFASVYALNPSVYVLDEPSSNLDIDSIYELKHYLEFVKSQGKTIVIAEHRLFYLIDIADRFIYLERGEIKKEYRKNELLSLDSDIRKGLGLRTLSFENELKMSEIMMLSKTDKLEKMNVEKDDLLQLINITISRNKQILLSDINAKVHTGEIIGILGMNGCGKTTLVRSLCGLHKEMSGDVIFNGRKMKQRDRMENSYLVMQDVNYQLFAESVYAECFLGMKNANEELVNQTLTNLDLYEEKDRHPATLSGGQKQRLSVAVGVMSGKPVLFFDEPTSGLDYDSMMQVAGIIGRLSKEHIIFIVTHDYEFLQETATRIFMFENGKLTKDQRVCMEKEEVLNAEG